MQRGWSGVDSVVSLAEGTAGLQEFPIVMKPCELRENFVMVRADGDSSAPSADGDRRVIVSELAG